MDILNAEAAAKKRETEHAARRGQDERGRGRGRGSSGSGSERLQRGEARPPHWANRTLYNKSVSLARNFVFAEALFIRSPRCDGN